MSLRKTGRMDANESAMFLREAEHVMAEVYNVLYPEYKALSYFPVKSEGGRGARTIVYRQFDWTGLAKLVNNYATDFPRVDVKGTEYFQAVKGLGDSYGWNEQELAEFLYEGRPIDSMRAQAAREAITRKMNKLAWFGDDEAGLKGIIYHPNVTKGEAPNGDWLGGSTTADEIIADVNDLINGPKILTKEVEFVDTVIMPTEQFAYIDSTPRSDTSDTTILEFLRKVHPGVTFLSAAELAGLTKKPSDGTTTSSIDVMIGYRRNPSKLWIAIPLEFFQKPPQEKGLEYVVYCYARFAGFIIPYPLSVQVSEGI